MMTPISMITRLAVLGLAALLASTGVLADKGGKHGHGNKHEQKNDNRYYDDRRDDVSIQVLGRWTSPDTGAIYPSRWRLVVPPEALDLVIEPWLEAQEMRTSFVYWEGAVRVTGTASGKGYVELTGYTRSMQGVF